MNAPLNPVTEALALYATADVVNLDASRSRYLSSNLAKARSTIALVCKLAPRIGAQAEDVGSALTRGDGAVRFAEMTAETVRDLRIAAADLETFCRLVAAEADDGPEAA